MPNRNWKAISTAKPSYETPRMSFQWKMQTTMKYAERREAILQYLRESEGQCIYINCKYQVQLKDTGAYPMALKRMLKEGLLKRTRTNWGGWCGRKQQSKIVLA